MKFGYEHEEAVSPVIGVILMVAITVILAAIVGMFVLNMGNEMETAKEVAVTTTMTPVVGDTPATVKAVLNSGKSIPQLTEIRVKWDGTRTDPEADPISPTEATYNGVDIMDEDKNIVKSDVAGEFHAGDVITLTFSEKDDDGKYVNPKGTLVISATFSDGKEQVIGQKTFP